MRRARFRSPEHRSRSFQSGPVGQCEYTNAAKGGGWHDLRNFTSELRGDLVGIKSSPASRTWFFFLAFSRHCSIGTKAAECRFKTACASWAWLAAMASCPSSAAAPEWLQMQRRVIPSRRLRRLPPNPSIEGTA
jgi:hypothetical protein